MAALRSSFRRCRLFSTTATTTTTVAPLSIGEAKAQLRKELDPDKALEIYNNVSDPNSSPLSIRYAQDLIVKRLAKSRRFADVEALINTHKKSPKITQENYFSTLIRSYGVAGMFDHAYRLFGEMEELGTPRSSLSFNALLSAYNMCNKFDQVPKLFDEIPNKYDVSPDKFSYGILIKSYCELSDPESAYKIMREMESKKIEVTTVTYTTVIDALYKKGKAEEAERVWRDMIKKGCSPDVTAYNVRIMHASDGKVEDVLGIIEEMKTAGVKPDTISYNYLYTCYRKNGMLDEAKKVFESLKENGCFPNAASFRLHIFNLCKNGDFGKAYEVFKESVKRNKMPPFGTMRVLVEGLVDNLKKKEAKEMARTVRKKIPANFLNAWKKLEDELGLSKKEETGLSNKEETVSA